MYSMALLCKEHSIFLPAVAVLTVALVTTERRFALRHAAIYLAACAPAALYVVVFRAWLSVQPGCSRTAGGGTHRPARIQGSPGRWGGYLRVSARPSCTPTTGSGTPSSH